MTFSIVAKCERTGQFGVGAMTAMPAVGKFLTHAWPRTGAVATQALVNPYLGIDGIAELRDGLDARQVVDRLKQDDPEIERRQFAVIDRMGGVAAHTGTECLSWAGHRPGKGYCVLGNRLEGEHVLDALEETLLATSELRLADRLVDALAAGYVAGGDKKRERSATIFVVDGEEYPLWDVRIDEHDDPVAELRRVHAIFGRDLYPHILEMPKRSDG
ncbi:DUF1028 domain-containing protein [Chelativorans sp. ZYF759]|uniref:DUF1028 domain-containing protein n=1 Tax=Chelativorans sp. ZYF759 TaxID=2692213 RepID=UPI00145E6FC6|nr:DUF1028 domain-containing protein [Chelativorans sp. ZYF759]NMG38049.1 DUF1028 domain-containing protein [Chelativorans sp. ZYF759]